MSWTPTCARSATPCSRRWCAASLAFPAAYALAFKVSPATRRLGVFLLITPFFTSYVVRVYSWQAVISDNGILNTVFDFLGFGPVEMLNTLFGTVVGYMTLCLPLVILLQLFSPGERRSQPDRGRA